MRKLILAFAGAFLLASGLNAQDFNKHFSDSTLRLDYVFAGNNKEQHIYVDELVSFKGWAGRRHRLSELPLLGNGQITVTVPESGEVIYKHSFSTLFQEWQSTEEAASSYKSFENSFLMPYPKHPVDVTVTLIDTHHKVTGRLTHRVNPSDILIRRVEKSEMPYKYIGPKGDPADKIDVAFVAEGYTEDEMPMFYAHCETAVKAILDHEPFKSLSKRFNFIAVASPSVDSGVSIPGQNIWLDTATGSHFDTFYSSRYLTTLHIKKLHDVLAGLPYEHIIILANTENYGGGGIYNSYTLTAARHSTFGPVVVHEFGHSFGGLADEYYYDDQYETQYPADTEPWEPNITTLVDFQSKWADMLPKDCKIPDTSYYDGAATMKLLRSGDRKALSPKNDIYNKIGVYEGAGYSSKGVYRPVHECRMKINEAPIFCPVCKRSLDRLIRFYTE